MSSPGTAAAGKSAPSVQIDAEDELMLARFGAAGGAHLFEYADKEETEGKKGKAHRMQRRVKRDHRNKRALATLEAGPDADGTSAIAPAAPAGASHGSEADEAAMAMARQQAENRLEQRQRDAERRRKLLNPAAPMRAEDAVAAAEAEGLQLMAGDTRSGFRGVIFWDASRRKPFKAMHGRCLGYYATAEEAALVYARHWAATNPGKRRKCLDCMCYPDIASRVN